MAKDENDDTTKCLVSEINKSKNYDYTAKERKQKERDEMKAAGAKRKELYAFDDDWPSIKEFAEKKLRKRLDKS